MYYLLLILLVLVGIIEKKSKVVTCFILSFMWLLFGLNTNNADRYIYNVRFYQYETQINTTEFGFNKLMQFCNYLGMDFQIFLMIFSAIFILTLYFVVSKLTENVNFVLSIYMIFPFCVDIVQIRNTCGFVFILFGFYFLLKYDNLKGIILFIFFCLLGSLFHISCICFLLLLFAKKTSMKKVLIVAPILFVVFYISLNSNAINSFITAVGWQKLINVSGRNDLLTDALIKNMRFKYVLVFGIIQIVLTYMYYSMKYSEQKKYIGFMVKYNVLLMLILPFFIFSVDLYRIQRYSLLFMFIAFSLYNIKTGNVLLTNTKLFKLSSSLFDFGVLSAILIIFITQIFLNNDINTVFKAVMEDNLIINLLFT